MLASYLTCEHILLKYITKLQVYIKPTVLQPLHYTTVILSQTSFLLFFLLLLCSFSSFLICFTTLILPLKMRLRLWMFTMLILVSNAFNCWPLRAFVRRSASYEWVGVKNNLMTLSWTLSLTKSQSICICLVLSWNIGFSPIYMAAWVPQKSIASLGWNTSKSFNKAKIQVISQVVTAMALYSASAEDLETMNCFLDFHEIRVT